MFSKVFLRKIVYLLFIFSLGVWQQTTAIKYSGVLQQAKSLESQIIQHRRTLHRIPELEFELYKTSAYVQGYLKKLGIPFKVYAKTGLVGKIGTGKPVIALRADMDALPIEEQSGVEFQSIHPGKMHACGHDSHTAMLLGAAEILKSKEKDLKGSVSLLFQPAEEVGNGAGMIMDEKAIDDAEKVFGFHVMPTIKNGLVAVNPSSLMGSVDEFQIILNGKGGHAAMPHLTVDPITTAADIITSLQKLVSREISPIDSPVVTVTKVEGGSAYNVIPDSVEIWGTIRTLKQENVDHITKRIVKITESIAEAHRCTANVTLNPRTNGKGLPPLVNSKEGWSHVVKVAKEVVGEENLIDDVEPILAGEDFAFYLEKMPGAFIFLGIKNEEIGSVHGLHSPKFRVDESALHVGSAMHAALALEYLQGEQKEANSKEEL